jgi:hypothetical protein
MWNKSAAPIPYNLPNAKSPASPHSLTQEIYNAHILHSSKDKLSAMYLDEYYQTYKLLAAYLEAI